MLKSSFVLLGCICFLLLTSCEKDDIPITQKDYVFLGHIYAWNSDKDKVDSRIENYNLQQFDEIWLGGDICAEASAKDETLDYLDDLFDLSANTTLWTIGNHDIINRPERIKAYTQKEYYYSQHKDGITKIVLNAQVVNDHWKDDCDYRQSQLDYIHEVLDTIQESSHLVMLMHNGIWEDIEDNMGARDALNASANWIKLTCEPATWFRLSIFPKLQEIQARGVQVILIAGDGGQYDKKYFYTTQEGIECYISGINNSAFIANPNLVNTFNTDPDSILIFHHDLEQKTLTGEFIRLY